jgi:ribosomal protein S18 acetylase RimI-like enzyme
MIHYVSFRTFGPFLLFTHDVCFRIPLQRLSLALLSWHGHVSAISVAPEFRRTGVANRLMEYLEEDGSTETETHKDTLDIG